MIYFDNASTSFPKPDCVLDFADQFIRRCGVSAGRGQYRLASEVEKLFSDTRNLLKEHFSAPHETEVVFTPTATIALNTILQGLPYKDNMNVYTTPFEHNAVSRTVYHMNRRYRFKTHFLSVSPNLTYDLDRIEVEFRKHEPGIVVCNHASNVCGLIAPVRKIFSLAKEYGAITILDASQTSGILAINLSNIFADFTVFAGHKSLYAPDGASGFLTNGRVKLPPFIYGGTGYQSASRGMPDTLPMRYEAGTANTYAIAGLYRSLQWLQETQEKTKHNLTNLTEYCLMELENIGIQTVSPIYDNIGIVSFLVPGYSPDEVGRILDANDIYVRTGLHCSPDTHRLLGSFPSGTVRVSFGYTNTIDEVQKMIEVLQFE